MAIEHDAARLAAVLNIGLLLGLAAIWGRNYLELRSRQTLGAVLFALLLLAENGLALYYYMLGPSLPVAVIRPMLYLQLLETAGVAFLLYVIAQ